jgi:hypothetical protein
VASLIRSDGPDVYCRGSVVYLSDEELDRLATFEGGYDLTPISVEVGKSKDSLSCREEWEPIAAVTYIKRDHTFIEPPCEAYLTAIVTHLKEHFDDVKIDISYRGEFGSVATEGVYVPPAPRLLRSLEALMVEINSHPQHEPKWVMPREGIEVAARLKVRKDYGVR